VADGAHVTTCLATQDQPTTHDAAYPSTGKTRSLAFGPFVLVPHRQLSLEDGVPIKVGRRALDLLTALVQRQGDLVSKHELMSHAWPGLAVDEGNLKVNIGALRRVLGDDSGEPRYIATVVGRGYRFVTPVQRTELHASRPSAVAFPTRSNDLPANPQRIFGREAAIASILQELQSSRLVTIVGPGGVGKTTVAIAVAHEAARAFEDGAWFVDLGAVNDDALVPEAVATAIGLSAPRGGNPVKLGALRDREMLLILDNCEHRIDAVARCARQVLTTAKHVRLLTTSRESLCIKEERVRRLSGLSLPQESHELRAEVALEFAAIQLFVDRATRKSRSFALSDANATIVAEICRRVDGLALAIEHVALRVDTHEVGGVLDFIDARSHMLDRQGGGLERHRTIDATIDWSYRLLSEGERAVMRRLSTFTAPFTLESACAVAASDVIDAATVVEHVAALAAKSLLITRATNGEMEYRQTNTTRTFALDRLARSGELESARRRHAEHSRHLAALANSAGKPSFETSRRQS
jgi:predicted ATPase/DNA-binding winged helix-turn-helix (wHTH) protein